MVLRRPIFPFGSFERYRTGRYVPWSVSGLQRWRHADETQLTSLADEPCSDHRYNRDPDDEFDQQLEKCQPAKEEERELFLYSPIGEENAS